RTTLEGAWIASDCSSFMSFSAIEVVKLVEILMMRDGGDGAAPGTPGNNADAAVWQRSDAACKRAPGRQSRCGDRERGVEEANLPLQGDVRRLERERTRAGVISGRRVRSDQGRQAPAPVRRLYRREGVAQLPPRAEAGLPLSPLLVGGDLVADVVRLADVEQGQDGDLPGPLILAAGVHAVDGRLRGQIPLVDVTAVAVEYERKGFLGHH